MAWLAFSVWSMTPSIINTGEVEVWYGSKYHAWSVILGEVNVCHWEFPIPNHTAAELRNKFIIPLSRYKYLNNIVFHKSALNYPKLGKHFVSMSMLQKCIQGDRHVSCLQNIERFDQNRYWQKWEVTKIPKTTPEHLWQEGALQSMLWLIQLIKLELIGCLDFKKGEGPINFLKGPWSCGPHPLT